MQSSKNRKGVLASLLAVGISVVFGGVQMSARAGEPDHNPPGNDVGPRFSSVEVVNNADVGGNVTVTGDLSADNISGGNFDISGFISRPGLSPVIVQDILAVVDDLVTSDIVVGGAIRSENNDGTLRHVEVLEGLNLKGSLKNTSGKVIIDDDLETRGLIVNDSNKHAGMVVLGDQQGVGILGPISNGSIWNGGKVYVQDNFEVNGHVDVGNRLNVKGYIHDGNSEYLSIWDGLDVKREIINGGTGNAGKVVVDDIFSVFGGKFELYSKNGSKNNLKSLNGDLLINDGTGTNVQIGDLPKIRFNGYQHETEFSEEPSNLKIYGNIELPLVENPCYEDPLGPINEAPCQYKNDGSEYDQNYFSETPIIGGNISAAGVGSFGKGITSENGITSYGGDVDVLSGDVNVSEDLNIDGTFNTDAISINNGEWKIEKDAEIGELDILHENNQSGLSIGDLGTTMFGETDVAGNLDVHGALDVNGSIKANSIGDFMIMKSEIESIPWTPFVPDNPLEPNASSNWHNYYKWQSCDPGYQAIACNYVDKHSDHDNVNMKIMEPQYGGYEHSCLFNFDAKYDDFGKAPQLKFYTTCWSPNP